MFAKSERLLVNDPDQIRRGGSPLIFGCDSPGPCAYPGNPKHRVLRSTRRYLFQRGPRQELNREKLKANTPGPGVYQPPDLWGSGRALGFAGPTQFSSKRPSAIEAGSLTKDGSAGVGATGGRVVRKEKGMVALPPPSPSPSWTSSPAKLARIPKGGREWKENLDGVKWKEISETPGPGDYKTVNPFPRTLCGSWRRSPRGLEKFPDNGVPGPGSYVHACRPQEQMRLPVSIPGQAGDRQLDRFACAVDLRKQRRAPGPTTYHPIGKEIVKRPYTV